MFWNSLSVPEKQDLVESFSYHLGSVKDPTIRQRNVEMWGNVDTDFATLLAESIGVEPPANEHVQNDQSYPSLSQLNSPHSAMTAKVGIVIGNGFDGAEVKKALDALQSNMAIVDIISESLGPVEGADGTVLEANKTMLTVHPVLYDSIYLVGGTAKNQMKFDQGAFDFFRMQYMHMKPILVGAGAAKYVQQTEENNMDGVILAADTPDFAEQYVGALAQKRFWDRT